MNLVSLATSRLGPSMVMFLCRVLSGHQIHRLASWISSYVSRQHKLPFVCALRANMAVVHGLPEDHPDVDDAVRLLILNALLSYADFFRAVQAEPREAIAMCGLDPSMLQTIEECRSADRGLILVGAHTCSFDILLLGLKEVFPSVQILSNADPQGSSRVMNEIRKEHGIEMTPISMRSLRQAVTRLREGGVVAIAADVPVEGGEELIFFGRDSQLPVGHARLALRTGAQMLVGVSHRTGEGSYRADLALATQPESMGDQKQDSVLWAQDSLSMLEDFIRRWPEEWMMPVPVWSG
jgi:lauroyl/myristoyl acyltransferase